MSGLAYVVMGVSGCGKSTVGSALAESLGHVFRDGDDLHPASNIAKMARGEPLTDEDRLPWLTVVARGLEPGTVIACSALRRSYRNLLRDKAPGLVVFIYLRGQTDSLVQRMIRREGHFMPLKLLHSQLATLEEPAADEHCITVDIENSTYNIVVQIVAELSKWSHESYG